MKQATIILAILLGFAVTSCDNGGDKTMYLQAQMVNHIGIAAFESEYTGTYRADAAVYEVVLDTENGKADVACRITLPTGKMGSIDLRGMSLSVDAKTGGYYIKQTADTRSQGSYTVTNFSGIIDLTSSTTSKSHFSFIVENHYQVNATIAEMRFTGVTADIKDADGNMRTLSNGTVVTTLNPTTKKASITITGLDYDGNLGKERTLTYENLDFAPCDNGYKIKASVASPTTNGDVALAKYKLKDFEAEIDFFDDFDASYTIDNIGEVRLDLINRNNN